MKNTPDTNTEVIGLVDQDININRPSVSDAVAEDVSGNTVRAKFLMITPEIAKDWLDNHNPHNRPLNQTHVKMLAGELSGGRWKFNGDTITFGESGNLLNGQHRLTSILITGKPIMCLVVFGVDDGAFDTIDSGRRRSPADTLAISGEGNSKLLAASLQTLGKIHSGKMRSKKTRFSASEVEIILRENPGIREAVERVREVGRGPMPASILIACYYEFRKKDPELADKVLNEIATGANLEAGNPILAVRERLQENASSKAKLSQAYICALLIKAWNMRRAGVTSKSLRFREAGDNPELFPTVM